MGRKNRFTQDTEVLIYRLQHGNVEEAKRLLRHISLVADSLAEDADAGQRKRFLEGASDLMGDVREQIIEMEDAGTPEAEVAESALATLNESFANDLTTFSLGDDDDESVDWESTADQLLTENRWLREELERAERDYMELYERARSEETQQDAT